MSREEWSKTCDQTRLPPKCAESMMTKDHNDSGAKVDRRGATFPSPWSFLGTMMNGWTFPLSKFECTQSEIGLFGEKQEPWAASFI
jgi:hypothetical protein